MNPQSPTPFFDSIDFVLQHVHWWYWSLSLMLLLGGIGLTMHSIRAVRASRESKRLARLKWLHQ